AVAGFPIEIDKRTEAPRFSTDDCNHQWKSEGAGARKRCGRAANTNPNRQRILHGPRIDALSCKRRSVLARPCDMLVLTDIEKQAELLGEELVVIIEAEAEQRKRFDRRAAADHHLRAALRNQIQRSELLKKSDGICSTQHSHRAGETNALCSRCGRGKNYCRRGVEEFLAVMFSDSEDVETN